MSTDSEIIRQSHDRPAVFGELFERHGGHLLRFVSRRIGGEDASDVVSETFLIAFKKRGRFDLSRESALPWLFGIATKELQSHLSDERRILRAIRASPLDHVAPDLIEPLTAKLDAAASVAGLAAALASLPRKDRDTLLLYAWGDLTYEGIAQATGTTIGTVKSRIHRARRRLQHSIPEFPADAEINPKGNLSWTS